MQADKVKVEHLLKTAKGQIEVVLKMIDENRYCIDISNQILAAESILRKTNREIIKAHMESCVRDAFEQGNEEEKINEIIALVDKLSK